MHLQTSSLAAAPQIRARIVNSFSDMGGSTCLASCQAHTRSNMDVSFFPLSVCLGQWLRFVPRASFSRLALSCDRCPLDTSDTSPCRFAVLLPHSLVSTCLFLFCHELNRFATCLHFSLRLVSMRFQQSCPFCALSWCMGCECGVSLPPLLFQ